MKKTDILVIGSGPAGMVSAITAKKFYPNKNILVIRHIERGCVPCGIPYMVSSLKNPADNKSGSDIAFKKNGIEVVTAEITKIDRKNNIVITKDNETYDYEKLVIATGSKPVIPSIEGINNKGVYPIYKDMVYLEPLAEKLKESKAILVIGGGFIGVEFADEAARLSGVKVYLVELLPKILSNSFDDEFSDLVKQKLETKGVEVITGVGVKKIHGDDQVKSVLLSDGRTLEIDSVVLGISAKPNSKLANDAELELDQFGAIVTDESMGTSDPDIFAVGDVAAKVDFFMRKPVSVMLASTATAEGRIAGANLYGLKIIKGNKGTIAIYSTCVDELVLASAGMTEKTAADQRCELIIGAARGFDKHPASMPGSVTTRVKLIFAKHSGILVGGQIAGGVASSELINIIGVAIQSRMTAEEIATMQFATHPYLTNSPTGYQIVSAAQEVASK